MNISSQSNELELWESFRSGSEKALEELYCTYYPVLLNYGHKFTPNRYFMEETVQELFVKLWNNRMAIGSTGSVKHYLFKAYRSILFRKLQRQAANVMQKLDDERYEFKIELSHDQKLIDIEDEDQLRARVEEGLSTLTPRQREAIYLRFYEDLSYEEVAAILDMNVGGAYKLIYRALDRLKDKFGGAFVVLFLAAMRIPNIFSS